MHWETLKSCLQFRESAPVPRPGSSENPIDQSKARETRTKCELVVIVHGTFANPTYDHYPSSNFWWTSHGSFGNALDRALQRHGSSARCNRPFDRLFRSLDEHRSDWLGWSGGNSEIERRQGAYRLAEYLRALQADNTIGTIHIVAHSHGGNVVRRALRYLNRPTHKLGRVIFLGTPFLHFNDRAAWRRWLSRVHWPMLISLAAILVGLWYGASWLNKSNDPFTTYVITGVIGGTLVSLWRYARSSEASSADVPAIALQFERDETIQLLRSCAEFITAPHHLLREILGGSAAPRQRSQHRNSDSDSRFDYVTAAIGRVAQNTFAWFSDLWNHSICRFVERITTWAFRLPILGAVTGSFCTLLLIMLFRPYRPALRPFLVSRLPRLRELFFHSMYEDIHESAEKPAEPDALLERQNRLFHRMEDNDSTETRSLRVLKKIDEVWKESIFNPEQLQRVAAFAPALVYWAFFYPLDKLAGLLPWLVDVTTRFFILTGARAAAGSAAGIDMLGAAFNARRTGELPATVEGLTIPLAIETDLERRICGRMQVDLTRLRHSFDLARSGILFDGIKTAFSEPGLLHAQYYQDERVVDYVAQLIAGTVTPEWHEALPQVSMSASRSAEVEPLKE